MNSKTLPIVIICFSALTFGILALTSFAFARTINVTSWYEKENNDNTTTFNGTTYHLTGTDDQIIKKYLALGEQFDQKLKPQDKQSVTFFFQNKSNVTVPTSGYKSGAAMELIKEELANPDNICWLYFEKDDRIWQQHYVCDWGPAHPP